MKIYSIDYIPGAQIEAIGLVRGDTRGYGDLIKDERGIAINMMINEAKALGADAIVGVRFETTVYQELSAQVLAYGTAVKIKD